MKPEQEYRNRIDKYFAKYFSIEREVKSIDGKRIDYVLKCDISKCLFGVEVKSINHKRGGDLVAYLKQASRYNDEMWLTSFYPKPTKLPIFIAPAVSRDIKQVVLNSKKIIDNDAYYKLFHQTDMKHCNVHGLISGLLNVGEIKQWHHSGAFTFMFHNYDIWTSHKNEKWRLKTKNYNKYFNFIDLNKVI